MSQRFFIKKKTPQNLHLCWSLFHPAYHCLYIKMYDWKTNTFLPLDVLYLLSLLRRRGIRDHSVHAPIQWEATLHCNVVSHWLGACTDWSLWHGNDFRIAEPFYCIPPVTKGHDAELWCLILFAWPSCWTYRRLDGVLRRLNARVTSLCI